MITDLPNELTKRFERLYWIYDRYATKNKDTKLMVVFQNCEILFYLHNENSIIDKFAISFDNSEIDLYIYMCSIVFSMLYGNIEFYKTDKVYKTRGYKSYISLYPADDNIEKVFDTLASTRDGVIKTDGLVMQRIRKTVKKRVYSNKFINQVDERINFTKVTLGV